MFMRRSFLHIILVLLSAILFVVFPTCRKSDYYFPDEPVVIRDFGFGTGTDTWTNNREYILEGFVFVNDGQVLTIEPGTVIRAKTGQGSAASALIVARGGRIIAEGAYDNPIIFTVEGDDLKGSVPVKTRGLWGGVIILGRARLNLSGYETHIEGIPVSEERGRYGGDNDEDDSGILGYISIRHGGTNIGEGNEINGLTLGGVGSNTIIHHIEVISNADDGFEFFGGTVNCKFLVSAFCGDDAFDYDLGYRGMGQFWLAIQEAPDGDKLLECDGGIDPITGEPYSLPILYNMTLIGSGTSGNKKLIGFDRNAGGVMANSIFIYQTSGITVEYIENSDDSFSQFERDNLQVRKNIFWQVAGNDFNEIFKITAATGVDVTQQNDELRAYFILAENIFYDPGIIMIDGFYDPIPKNDVSNNMDPYPDPWFDEAGFKGAFLNYNWFAGWTLLSEEYSIP